MATIPQYIRVALATLLVGFTNNAVSQIVPGSVEAESDWMARSTAADVFYANNFSNYLTTVDLHNAANSLTHNVGAQEVILETARAISGNRSLRIKTLSTSGKNGGAWGDQYRNGDTVNNFYFQVALYLPKETIGWRTKEGDGQLKLVNLERYGSGQVVIHHNKFLGFPTLMTNGAGVVQRYLEDIPYRSDDWFYQNAIDSSSSLAGGNKEDYWRRYGPARSVVIADDYSYVSDNVNGNFLYNRTTPWPNPDALASGAVPWNLDGWTVIEVYISTDSSGTREAKMWAAPYGEEPTLVVDTNAPNSDMSQAPSFAEEFYSRFELLNYETPRSSETGYRPDLDTYFDEVVASSSPIPFPGGHQLTNGGSGSPGDDPGDGPGSSGLTNTPAPDWVKDIPIGTWTAVGTNTMADLDPEDDPSLNPNYPGNAPWHGTSGQISVMRAWSGGALATGLGSHGSLLTFGGGHAAYYGSEVYAFDIATRTWKRVTDPYAGPFNWPYNTGNYPDGSPLPPHTYDYAGYHPKSNSFIVMKSQSEMDPPSNQTSLPIPHMLDLDTGNWRRGPMNANDPNLFSGGYSAYDPVRDLFWAHGGSGSNNFVSYDPNGSNSDGTVGSWSTYDRQLGMTDSQAEYDPKNDILVVTGFRNDTRIAAIDLKDPSKPFVWLNEMGTPPNKSSQHGWSWSKKRQSFLYYRKGSGVYEFQHKSGDWKSGEWIWRNLVSSNNSVTPASPAQDNGIYSRFQVVTYADAEIAIAAPVTNGPVYVFKVPPAVIPKAPNNMSAAF